MITIGEHTPKSSPQATDKFAFERDGNTFYIERSNLILQDSAVDALFDARLATKDSDDLSEGASNLYFSNERVDDRAAALIQDGTGIAWTYNDGAQTLTPTISLSSFNSAELSEGLGNKYVKQANVNLNTAAILALNSSPKTLLTPGASKHIEILGVFGTNNFGTTAFSGNQLELFYSDGSENTLLELSQAFTQAASTKTQEAARYGGIEYLRGNSLGIRANGADPTLGDGGITVSIIYAEIDI